MNVSTVDEHQKVDVLEPFTGVFMGFGEILGAFLPAQQVKNPVVQDAPAKKKSGADASKKMWLLLKNYKKAHQLLTW